MGPTRPGRRKSLVSPAPFFHWLLLLSCLALAGCGDDDDPIIVDDCGNGTADPGEECDGSDLRGESCSSMMLGNGTLRCNADCTYDTSSCILVSCNNGIIDAGEACDGSNLNGEDCTTLGYSEGYLYCDSYCQFDDSDCSGTGENCGNGIAEGQEECDASDLNGYDCIMLGHGGGTLACDQWCWFDESGCTS